MGEVVGWGLVGCGDIAEKRVARALREGRRSALVAVARARTDLAADFAARHGARRSHADWRELLRDPDVGAVYVATPVGLHAEQAVAAAEPASTSSARSRWPSTSRRASGCSPPPARTASGSASRTT